LEELIAALKAHHIELVCDVRSFPLSARHPQFNRENLQVELPKADISYHWFGENLGGYRKKKSLDSAHTVLRSAGFRNYADHMETDAFRQGVEELLALAEEQRAAYMCAERLWWRCHRSLISDCLAAVGGVEVIHIHDQKKTEPHRVSKFVRMVNERLIYDVGESGNLL
jgi:uncharacterized protein (DUF488 family)